MKIITTLYGKTFKRKMREKFHLTDLMLKIRKVNFNEIIKERINEVKLLGINLAIFSSRWLCCLLKEHFM